MAEKELLYRLDDPELQIRGSGNWVSIGPIGQRIYSPVASTPSWVTEFEGETRFAIAPPGDGRGPWSVVFTPPFDIGDFIIEITRMGETGP